MLLSFRKDKAFINILSDLELFLSETADKLDIGTKALSTMTTVDNTRKFRNWNKIETVDTSNYIKFFRYDIDVNKKKTIPIPWKGYSESKDISVMVYYKGQLMIPKNAAAGIMGDYSIRAEADSSNYIAGYIVDFQSYIDNHNLSYLEGPVTILRTTTNLPINVSGIDIAIERYDKPLSGDAPNYPLPFGSITENDISLEVYVNGVLFREDPSSTEPQTYRIYNTYILFSQAQSGVITFIRKVKV